MYLCFFYLFWVIFFYHFTLLKRWTVPQSATFCNSYGLRLPVIFIISLSVSFSYLPNPSARAGYDTRSIFKRCLTGLNSEFFLLLDLLPHQGWRTSLPYYLPIAGGRLIGFIPFPRVLVLCEMQSVSSSIWTRVAVSISYDDNHYTTGTCLFLDHI